MKNERNIPSFKEPILRYHNRRKIEIDARFDVHES